MLILGIESSCDETAAAVLNGRLDVLSSVVSSQIELHRVTQGVVPEVAARAHTEKIIPVIAAALKKAQVQPNDLDAVAVTKGPGLITSLLVGLETAKSLAFALNIPLIGINHIEGHVLSSLLTSRRAAPAAKVPARRKGAARGSLTFDKKRLPIVVLTVSGGHTELLLLRELGRYQILGRTRDDAAGEAFDKVARLLGLPYPGGPAIGTVAQKGDPTRISFPRPMLNMPNYDFSFAGLKTAVARELDTYTHAQIKKVLPDIAASFEQAVVDTLLGKSFRAIEQYNARELWIVGGVAANKRLRSQAAKRAQATSTAWPAGIARTTRKAQAAKSAQAKTRVQQSKINLVVPNFEFCTDNAVMIAAVGVLKYRQNKFDRIPSLQADPNLDLITAT